MEPTDGTSYHTELIEQYLLGELSGEALTEFLHRLQTDNAFAREVTIQRAITEQTRKVGREELHQQLKELHRQSGFVHRKRISFPFFYAAATVAVLLVTSFIFYFLYRKPTTQEPAPTITRKSEPARLAYIRFQSTGQPRDLGFSGVKPDTTIAILLYPAQPGSPSYQFDDTLRLYGSLRPAGLLLQYDPSREQYTLHQDTLRYPLQRYHPVQELNATR